MGRRFYSPLPFILLFIYLVIYLGFEEEGLGGGDGQGGEGNFHSCNFGLGIITFNVKKI